MSNLVLVETPIYVLKAELNLEAIFLHLEYKSERFTKTMYKSMLEDWLDITTALKESNVKEVYSCVPEGDKKIRRWQTMFGLEPLFVSDEIIIYRGIL